MKDKRLHDILERVFPLIQELQVALEPYERILTKLDFSPLKEMGAAEKIDATIMILRIQETGENNGR